MEFDEKLKHDIKLEKLMLKLNVLGIASITISMICSIVIACTQTIGVMSVATGMLEGLILGTLLEMNSYHKESIKKQEMILSCWDEAKTELKEERTKIEVTLP